MLQQHKLRQWAVEKDESCACSGSGPPAVNVCGWQILTEQTYAEIFNFINNVIYISGDVM